MRNIFLPLVSSTLLVLGSAIVPAGAATPVRPLLTHKIDETRLVRLNGNTRAAARDPRNDRGMVGEGLALDHMLLLLQRPAEKEAELTNLVSAMHTPGSAEFHQWLTPAEFGAQFGLAKSDIDTVTEWLRMHGLVVNQAYANGTMIDFSGTAAQVREAFHVQLHDVEVNGEQHVANVSDPMIPVALAPAIRGIVSLNDFRPHTLHTALTQSHVDARGGNLVIASQDETRAGNAGAEYNLASRNNTYQAVVPGDLARIYNLTPLFNAGYSGQGQTIAIIGDSDVYSTADWTAFRNAFGLARYAGGSFTQVHPGNCADPGVNADGGEAILDAEYASAAAPSAAIQVVACADTSTTFGGLIALQNLINGAKTPPSVISLSYGECEAENGATANASYSAAYQQAAAEGISVFVAAGDEGAAGCDPNASSATHGNGVNGFASTAYNVAVGGTDFGDSYAGTRSDYWNPTNAAAYTSAKSYINEIPWNDSCAGALLAKAAAGSAATFGANGFCNSVTGTDYYRTTTAGSGGPSSCYSGVSAASGIVSGSCQGNAKPSWQAGLVGVPNDGVRDLPDVSLFAGNGVWGHYYVYCYSDTANGGAACSGAPSTWSGAGGTSFAAPIMAGIQSLVNQKVGARQGNPNPVYYRLASMEYGLHGSSGCNSSHGSAVGAGCIFYDVTQGDTDVNCTGSVNCYMPSGVNGILSSSASAYKPTFDSGAGFDFATGIGSINAYNLAYNWPQPLAVKAIAVGVVTHRTRGLLR